jgi:hypothetical protein
MFSNVLICLGSFFRRVCFLIWGSLLGIHTQRVLVVLFLQMMKVDDFFLQLSESQELLAVPPQSPQHVSCQKLLRRSRCTLKYVV